MPLCRKRFKSTPHLYIGLPGHKAPKQKGVQIIKQRRLKLKQTLSSPNAEVLAKELCGMMGIRKIHINGMHIDVIYDLMEATAEQLEDRMVEIGAKLGEEWSQRLRRGFIHFLEETEVSNMEELPQKY